MPAMWLRRRSTVLVAGVSSPSSPMISWKALAVRFTGCSSGRCSGLDHDLDLLASARGGERLRRLLERVAGGDDPAELDLAGERELERSAAILGVVGGGAGDVQLAVVLEVGVDRDRRSQPRQTAEEVDPPAD